MRYALCSVASLALMSAPAAINSAALDRSSAQAASMSGRSSAGSRMGPAGADEDAVVVDAVGDDAVGDDAVGDDTAGVPAGDGAGGAPASGPLDDGPGAAACPGPPSQETSSTAAQARTRTDARCGVRRRRSMTVDLGKTFTPYGIPTPEGEHSYRPPGRRSEPVPCDPIASVHGTTRG